MSNFKKNISFIVLLTFYSLSHLFLFSCKQNKRPEEVTIGIQNSPSNSLVIIASAKGFFDSSKVKVTVKEFSAGKLALQALLGQANDIDVAVSAETPVVLSVMGGNQLKII